MPGSLTTAVDQVLLPHPASFGKVMVAGLAVRTGTSIELLDAVGRSVLRTVVSDVFNGIAVDGLDAGRYKVRCTTDRGQVTTTALLIVH